ncbi:MAG: extracellular solute-binding protein, partial [Acetobacteraceae bacterium]
WAPPNSWNDLKDPKYKGILVVPPLNGTYGLEAVLMFAKLNGGGEADINPGFQVMKDQVGPNVLVYEASPGKMSELFQSGQVVIAVWGSGRVRSLADTGFPVDFVYPKEGVLPLLTSACAIRKPNPSPLAQALIEYLLTPGVQKLMAVKYGYGPVNKAVQIAPDQAGMMPIGPRAETLVPVDWTVVNAHREAWEKRWDREIER